MADNVELNPMIGGVFTATDDIGGVHYQRIKIALGADGAFDGDVSSANKLPVVDSAISDRLGEVQASPTANTLLARIKSLEGYLDGVEGYVDGIEALLTTIDGRVDGVETLLTAIDGHVDGIEGSVDGIEALIGTTNTNTGGAATSLAIMDDWDNTASDGASVTGDVAHDGVDAGEPVKIGFKAVAHGANPGAVAAADRTDAYANRHGVQFVIGGHPNVLTKELNITAADGAQTDTALVTVGSGAKVIVTMIQAMCDKANSVDVGYRIGFGTANTPAADSAGIVSSHPGVAAGSGVVAGNGGGIIGCGGDNEDLRLTCEVPTSGAINFIVTYYTIES